MTGQFAYPPDREEASAKKAAALESVLIEKGVITPQTVDKVLAYFETEMTPLNGKKIVVKAWTVCPKSVKSIRVNGARGSLDGTRSRFTTS